MKKIILAALAMIFAITGIVFMNSAPVMAETTIDCAILDCSSMDVNDTNGGGIFSILKIVVDVLTFGVGIAATVGFIITGYQYMTSRDNAAQVVKAKNRIINIVIGLVMYALIWALINFLIPGGVLNG